jgi:phospholipid/cholesterol/gamma-HCH transport system substrate-binding protein
MSDSVARAGKSATNAVDSTRADVQRFSNETLPELRQLVGELRELTSTLQRVGGELERNPSVLLRGKPAAKRGPGE